VTAVRLRPMTAVELDDWRAARGADGVPLPDPGPDSVHEAVTIEVDGVTVGGALLALIADGARVRCSLLVLQTTIPRDATEVWTAVASALEADARARGASMLTAAVAPQLASAFGRAGFSATMLSGSGAHDPDARPDLQEDRRVSVRPMTAEERSRFVVDAREVMLTGMARAGVIEPDSGQAGALDDRLDALSADPAPAQELLLTATLDGRPVGSAWATLVPRGDATDYYGHTMFLHPEHRGRGLSKSFLGALVRSATDLGVADIYFRVYAHDRWARHEFMRPEDQADAVDEVHVRKDLG
jgi:GNAT superfamily N-acetyltransferase